MRINKVLVTNDDGYNSIGIKLLSDILKNFTNEIYVVAPKNNMSGSSRSIIIYLKMINLIIFFLALMLEQILVTKFHIQELSELLLRVL